MTASRPQVDNAELHVTVAELEKQLQDNVKLVRFIISTDQILMSSVLLFVCSIGA